jgi:predicted lipase
LSRPVYNLFIKAPPPNCLKTYKNKLAISSKSTSPDIRVFDMRKLNKEYSKYVNEAFDSGTKKYLIKEISKKFEESDKLQQFQNTKKVILKHKIFTIKELSNKQLVKLKVILTRSKASPK